MSTAFQPSEAFSYVGPVALHGVDDELEVHQQSFRRRARCHRGRSLPKSPLQRRCGGLPALFLGGEKNDAGKQGFSAKMYKNVSMLLSNVAGRHVWRTVKTEISDLKKLFGSCLVGLQM